MKKKVIILGSTGSVGKNTLEVLKKNKKEFEIICLSTNKNINIIYKQIKEFNVKNVIIVDKKKYILAKKKFSGRKLNIFNNFDSLDKILLKKKSLLFNDFNLWA